MMTLDMATGQVWKRVRKNPDEVTVIVLIERYGHRDWTALLLDDWRDSRFKSPRRVGTTMRFSIMADYGWQRVS
jgi:hypothetical protein